MKQESVLKQISKYWSRCYMNMSKKKQVEVWEHWSYTSILIRTMVWQWDKILEFCWLRSLHIWTCLDEHCQHLPLIVFLIQAFMNDQVYPSERCVSSCGSLPKISGLRWGEGKEGSVSCKPVYTFSLINYTMILYFITPVFLK